MDKTHSFMCGDFLKRHMEPRGLNQGPKRCPEAPALAQVNVPAYAPKWHQPPAMSPTRGQHQKNSPQDQLSIIFPSRDSCSPKFSLTSGHSFPYKKSIRYGRLKGSLGGAGWQELGTSGRC